MASRASSRSFIPTSILWVPRARILPGEDLPETGRKRVAEDLLHRHPGLLRWCVVPATRSASQLHPVRRQVAGALVPRGVDEGLEVVDGVAVDPLPVPGEEPRHLAQDVGGEV